jgi:hypothetical protein
VAVVAERMKAKTKGGGEEQKGSRGREKGDELVGDEWGGDDGIGEE